MSEKDVEVRARALIKDIRRDERQRIATRVAEWAARIREKQCGNWLDRAVVLEILVDELRSEP